MPEPSIESVEQALVALAERIDVTGADRVLASVVAGVEAQPEFPRSWRRPLLLVAAAVLLLAIAVAAVPSTRRAVADWFGLGSVEVVRVPELPEVVIDELQLGRPVTAEEAGELLGAPLALPDDPALGAPAIYADTVRGHPIITAVYADSELPATGTAGVGLLVTQLGGATEEPLLRKVLEPGTRWEVARVNGNDGYWIEGGPHLLVTLDDSGGFVEDSTRLADNVLVWSEAGTTFRLEGAFDRDRALDLAASMG